MVKRKNRSWSSESGSANSSGSGDPEYSCSEDGSKYSSDDGSKYSSDDGSSCPDDGSEYSHCSDDGSYSSDGGSVSSKQGPKIASFSLSQVLFGEEDSGSEDAYQTNGKSGKRVRRALGTPCCRRQCKRRLVFRSVMALVCAFWGLTKSGQDAILWSLQHPVWTPHAEEEEQEDCSGTSSSSGSASSKSTQNVAWYIEGGVHGHVLSSLCAVVSTCVDCMLRVGHRVCRAAFVKILGISPGRLVRCRSTFRGQDLRTFRAWSVQCYVG